MRAPRISMAPRAVPDRKGERPGHPVVITDADREFDQLVADGFAPGEIEELTAELAERLYDLYPGATPRISHVVPEPVDDGRTSAVFHVHLTSRLILPVFVEGDAHGLNVGTVVHQVQKLWPHLDAIVRRAEEELVAFETCLDEAGADLTDIRMRRVGLAAEDTWPDLDLPCLAPEIDVLGDGLRRETRTMHWSACAGLESEYEGLVTNQAMLSRLRRLFVGRRSTGVIDQLAASAVRSLPDPCGTLRALGRHDDIWPEASLHLRWSEGRVQSDGNGFQGLSWSGRVLSFPGKTLPETALTAMVGRPVTDMCGHPLLEDEMTVARAWNEAVDGASTGTLKVAIASVDRLFSAARATVDPQPFKVVEALADHET